MYLKYMLFVIGATRYFFPEIYFLF